MSGETQLPNFFPNLFTKVAKAALRLSPMMAELQIWRNTAKVSQNGGPEALSNWSRFLGNGGGSTAHPAKIPVK
jgi:hypothetical protein